jgi:uncharacterized protein
MICTDDNSGMDYLPRHAAAVVRRAATTFPAVLLTGARQTGKTTLLGHEFGSTHAYVSFERPDRRAQALADPVGFFRENPPPLILDEIQYVPSLLHYIKDHIDEDRTPGRWLLTGSQSLALMQGITQTLAGRVAVLSLGPLTVAEVRGRAPFDSLGDLLNRVFGDVPATAGPAADPGEGAGPEAGSAVGPAIDLGGWILRGGYPEPRLNDRVDLDLWFSSYIQTYLERDVRDLRQVGSLEMFSRFLALVATRTGNLLNLAELGREAGVSAPTARQWLSVLEAGQVVFLLPPYHRNLGKRIRKSPKLYLADPALARFLLGLHSRQAIIQGPSFGALAETAVISDWWQTIRNLGARPQPFHWRSSKGTEVDLILEHDGEVYGIEVKATATPTPRQVEGLVEWRGLAGKRVHTVLACQVEQPVTLAPGVRAVPWHLSW